MERLWKFVKKPCLYSKYYPDSESFQHALKTCIEQAPTTHQAALKTLLTLRFHTFKEVPVIATPHTVSKSSKKKVLSQAA